MPYSRAVTFANQLEAIVTRRRWANPYCGQVAKLTQAKFVRATSMREKRENARKRAYDALHLAHSRTTASCSGNATKRDLKQVEAADERSLRRETCALWREQNHLEKQRASAPVDLARASVEAEREGVRSALSLLEQPEENTSLTHSISAATSADVKAA